MKIKLRDEQKGVFFISLIGVIVFSLILIFSFALKTNSVEDTIREDEVVRMLYVVEDYDSTMLFSNVLIYYPSSHRGAIFNIPGYTGAIFQSLGRTDKLKKVYEEVGMTAYRNEVEKMLGMVIPFQAVIKLDDFTKLCDYLGGMRVFISAPVDIVSANGERWLLPSGAITLDGDKLSTYLHYKLSDESEVDVQERYQNIMAAFLTGLHDKSFMIFKKDNFKRFSYCIDVNISEDDEKETLFSVISEIDTESIILQTITGSMRNVDGQQLLFPLNNGEFIKEAIKQTTNMLISADGSLTSRVYVLEIQNGTTTQGLARNTAILFQNASYNVLTPINADSNDYEETVIIDHLGNEEVARSVGEFIHCTNIVQADSFMEAGELSYDTDVDFTIILGKDFDGRYVQRRRSSK